jgi:UDP-N-acetylmuramyl pentapeptide phosphotransferase/UDP-N-acetylglucosamine-1-phosphate transferase
VSGRQARRRDLRDAIPPRFRVRITPLRIAFAVPLAGGLVLFGWSLIDRGRLQIPLMAASLTVLALTFAALAVTGGVNAYRAGSGGDGAAAFWAALLGGAAAVISLGALAVAIVLALIWRSE